MTTELETNPSLSPAEQIAFPFLESAVLIDNAKQDPHNRSALLAVLDRNVSLWLYLRSQVEHNPESLPPDLGPFLVQISEFLIKSLVVLEDQADEELLQKIIQLNLNMSELILKGNDLPPAG